MVTRRALIMSVLVLAAANTLGAAPELKTRFEVTIDLAKQVYRFDESLEGDVVIKNTAPATLPGTFIMELYHDGDLRYKGPTAVNTLLTGTTKINLKKFGIPNLPHYKSTVGQWRIVIYPINHPEKSAEAEFEIKE